MTNFSDPIWGLVATFSFVLFIIVVVCAYRVITNRQQLKALEMMKELADELEYLQGETKERGQKLAHSRKRRDELEAELGDYEVSFNSSERERKAMRNCAMKALREAKDENAKCKACGHGGGEHGACCPIATIIDIPLMVVDFDLHGLEYVEENGGAVDES